MAITIVPYTAGYESDVAAFNGRLRATGVSFQFPQSAVPHWLPPVEGSPLYQEMFLAVDSEGVHGAYILKHQKFHVNGEMLSIGNFQLPLSEGTVDRKYNLVGVRLLSDALKRQPLLYALGMGGTDRPLPRLLATMGWTVQQVPFLYRIIHPAAFLRNITLLRTSVFRRMALDILAFSGAGWLGITLYRGLKERSTRNDSHIGNSDSVIPSFDTWADTLCEQTLSEFSLAAVRDRETLCRLYPDRDERFIRIAIKAEQKVVGWAVVLDTQMNQHKQFGAMRVGTIVDCLVVPGYEKELFRSSVRLLSRRGVDLIVTNQMHQAYIRGARASGLTFGPSNFALALSPDLMKRLGDREDTGQHAHFTRGDGDGPINL